MGVTSMLVEGGGELNAGFLREGLVNRVVAPALLGGQKTKGTRRLAEVVPVGRVFITGAPLGKWGLPVCWWKGGVS